jgi:hypothetical protein
VECWLGYPMASPRLQTPRAIGGCSLRQLIIFYLSPIHRVIYDTPSTVGGTHGAPSMLRANDNMRTRFGTEKNMIRITASLREVRPPELSRQRFDRRHDPGTIEAPRQQLPSLGPTSSSSTGGHMWSIGAHSTSQGQSMAP